MVKLRLTKPQADLDAVAASLSEIVKAPQLTMPSSTASEWPIDTMFSNELKEVMRLFIMRCNGALAVDDMILDVCRETKFKETAAAQSVFSRYKHLKQYITSFSVFLERYA